MRIACVLADGFEDSEFAVPYRDFREAGHDVVNIGAKAGTELRGKAGKEKATVDVGIDAAKPNDFDALFIPGGHSPDQLRADDRFVRFTAAFADAEKPILAICHAAQLLTSADAIRGRRLTAWKTVQQDLIRMGEKVDDRDVVVDGQLVTSRQPSDLGAFVRESLGVLNRVPAGR